MLPTRLHVARPDVRDSRSMFEIFLRLRADAARSVMNVNPSSVGANTSEPLSTDLADIVFNDISHRGTSKPRLGTTWDDFRRPRRPQRFPSSIQAFGLIGDKQTNETGTFQPRSGRFEASLTSVWRPSRSGF